MFQAGDLVVYGQIGVCRVRDVRVPDFCEAGEQRLYYELEPQQQSGTVFIPVDTEVFMRPILTREEAERLIGLIPSIQAKACNSSNLQELTQQYSAQLRSHSCADLVALIMSIYAKKQDRRQNNRKIGAVDEAYMKRAEALLHSELALALGIEEAAVPAYIAGQVRRQKQQAKDAQPQS